MKRRILTVYVAAMLLLAAGLGAQDKPKPTDTKPMTPVRIQVVFSEYEGETKVVSLPYVLLVNADEPRGESSSLRMGIRVPVSGQVIEGNRTVQYMDVGTDIDCSAKTLEDGRFHVQLRARRSSVYSVGEGKKPIEGTHGITAAETNPILNQSSQFVHLLLRDGQTIQAATSTDPVSGRVLKLDVTLNVVK